MSSPRGEFMRNDEFVKQHNKLLENAAYVRAKEVALAEFVKAICSLSSGHDLNSPGRPAASAASFDMICGAYNFIEVMDRLSTPYPKTPPPDKIESLTGN